MNIANLYSYSLPTSIRALPIRSGLLLEWNGGWGEIAPLPGFSSETLEEAKEEISTLLPHLATRPAKLPSVRFAIDCAKLPFPPKPFRIPLAAFQTPRPNFPILKLKLGHLTVEEAVTFIKKMEKTHRLRLDFNQKWDLHQALELANHFPTHNFDYLEEPVSSLEDLITFSKLTKLPIAIDESFRTNPEKALQVLSLQAVVVKPTITGFIPQVPPHVTLVLSSSYETSLGLLQIARMGASLGNPITAHGLDTYSFFHEDLLSHSLEAKEGHLLWKGGNVNKSKLCWIATHSSPSKGSY